MTKKKGRRSKNGTSKPEQEQTLEQLLADQGFEGATSGSYAMPFLRILQKGSPEVDKDETAYIKGAKPGMILHTVRKAIFSEVTVIPLKYRDTRIEWVPRTKGGGFVSEWDALDPITKERLATCTREDNSDILPNGNEFKLHSNYFCALEIAEGEYEPIMISMSASQLKTSRIWLSTLRGMTLKVGNKTIPARNIRSYQWLFGTEKLSNDKGIWFGWTYEALEDTRFLPQIGPIQESVATALQENLLTYDRSQQQGEASENAL